MASDPVGEAKALVAELCAGLYRQGHVSGTGGGISIKVDTPEGDRIVMAPSGVQVKAAGGVVGCSRVGAFGCCRAGGGTAMALPVAVDQVPLSCFRGTEHCPLAAGSSRKGAALQLLCTALGAAWPSQPTTPPAGWLTVLQKERMRPEDMFVLDAAGEVLHTPEARPPPYKPPKLSECAPLFMSVRASNVGVGGCIT